MPKTGIILLLIMFTAFNCHSQFNNPVYKHGSVGISVVDLSNGKPVVNRAADKSLTPASTLKLLTTATALEILGSGHQFKTEVFTRGTVENGVLRGDLVVRGGGDPTLGSRYFYSNIYSFLDNWIEAIKQNGIQRINGQIIADASLFYPEPLPSRWIWEDIGNYYGAGVYPLSCFDNYVILTFYPAKVGEKARVASVDPNIAGLSFNVQAVGSLVNKDSAYIYGGPFLYDKVVRGSIPANKLDFSIKGAIPNPPLSLMMLLKSRLENEGIEVSGEAVVSQDPLETSKKITETVSPQLGEIAKVLNYESINLFAEHLFRALNPQKDNAGIVHLIKAFWKSKGIETTSCFIYDGSGLSPSNAVSPRFMTDVLTYMATRSNEKETFFSSIPKAGTDGTVRYFFNGNKNAEVLAKSGSMDKVRCYSGYIKKGGETFAFSIMLNKFTCSQGEVVKDIEAYLEDLTGTL